MIEEDKLKRSILAIDQGVAKNWENIVCKKKPDENGIITIERDGIKAIGVRVCVRIHKDFFVLEEKNE